MREHSGPAVSTDTEVEEIFVILSARRACDFGRRDRAATGPGTVGTLKKGEATRWEVDEPLKKVWIMPK